MKFLFAAERMKNEETRKKDREEKKRTHQNENIK